MPRFVSTGNERARAASRPGARSVAFAIACEAVTISRYCRLVCSAPTLTEHQAVVSVAASARNPNPRRGNPRPPGTLTISTLGKHVRGEVVRVPHRTPGHCRLGRPGGRSARDCLADRASNPRARRNRSTSPNSGCPRYIGLNSTSTSNATTPVKLPGRTLEHVELGALHVQLQSVELDPSAVRTTRPASPTPPSVHLPARTPRGLDGRRPRPGRADTD